MASLTSQQKIVRATSDEVCAVQTGTGVGFAIAGEGRKPTERGCMETAGA